MKYQKRIAITKIMDAGYKFKHQFGHDSVLKQCTCCLEWKYLNEYYSSSIGYLGLMPECKVCSKKHSVVYNVNSTCSLKDFLDYREKMQEGKIFEGHWKLKNYNTNDVSYDLITDPKVLEILEKVIYRKYKRVN